MLVSRFGIIRQRIFVRQNNETSAPRIIFRQLTHHAFPDQTHFPSQPTVDKVPGGPNTKVFIGVSVMLGLCAVPVFSKPNEKRGHDLFSQEKPEAVVASTERLQREYYKKSQQEK